MSYFLGSMFSFLVIFIFLKLSSYDSYKKSPIKLKYSQSHIFELVKPILPEEAFKRKRKETQTSKHERKTNVRVIILDRKAYFVRNSLFYVADMDGNDIDTESATLVDTMSMDKVQLDKMLFIMDQLKEGDSNDSGGARN
jgi:hypothetical protein